MQYLRLLIIVYRNRNIGVAACTVMLCEEVKLGSGNYEQNAEPVEWLFKREKNVCDYFRFIGSAKIFLRDLASGQTRSLPSKNVPLMNEKQQTVGVNYMLNAYTDIYLGESVVECSRL